MTNTTQNLNWIDEKSYPFQHRYMQLQSGKMHYIDEGKGEIILFVHGTPTWSFLYRYYISKLSTKYRCIAIDHIGFGCSEKPSTFDGTPQSHSKNLSEFIQKLNLTNITIVVHDFGGPIGLSSAIKNNDKIKQIVLFNSWLWETKTNLEAVKVDKLIHKKMTRFLYLKLNFSARYLFKQGFHNKQNLTKKLHHQYTKPFPNSSTRHGLLNIAKSLVGSSDWYQSQWENLYKIEDKPWLILWGNQDKFIKIEFLEKWKKRLPNASLTQYECGHFIQEEKPKETLLAIESFLKRK